MREIVTNIFLIVGTVFIFSVFVTHLMKRVAIHIGAIDVPRAKEGNRHIHKKPIPKLGGLAIFLSFLFGYLLFGVASLKMNAVIIGGFIIVLVGMIDDIHDIKAKYQLIGQIIAALVVVLFGEILLEEITVFGLNPIKFGIFSYPITLFFILGCINIIKFIDGIDGESGGITSIFYITVGYIAIMQGKGTNLETLLAFIMLGATLGFLVHNFHPASIFAGETCQFMGYIIAVISLLGHKTTALTTIFIPILVLAIPVLDTLFAIIRRALKKENPFSPDREHIHHQLLNFNLSQRKTVIVIYTINILFAIATVYYTLYDAKKAMVIYGILMILVTWFVLHTTIISEKAKQRTMELTGRITKLRNNHK